MAKQIQHRKAYRALPHDFSTLRGIAFDDVSKIPYNLIPDLVFWEHTLCLPVTDEQLDAFFASLESGLFKVNSPEGNCPGITTSAQVLATVSPTIICGMCIVAVGEGLNFCLPGVTVECEPGATPGPAPAVPGAGCEGGAIAQAGQTPAVMQYGGVTWQFIEAFFRAYSVQVLVNDCLVVDLPVSDVGMCEIAPSFSGAGDSCVSVMPFIRETNQHAQDNGIDCQFLPVNVIVTTGCDGVCTSICAPPPSAAATWGHTMFTGRNPKMFKFPRAITLIPALTNLDIAFEPYGNNTAFKNQMRAAVVAGTKALGAVTCGPVGPSACFNNDPVVPGGCGPAVAHWPGGKVTIGVRLLGFRMSYSLCVDALSRMVQDASPLSQLYINSGFVQGLLGKMDKSDPRYSTISGLASGNLAGLPSAD